MSETKNIDGLNKIDVNGSDSKGIDLKVILDHYIDKIDSKNYYYLTARNFKNFKVFFCNKQDFKKYGQHIYVTRYENNIFIGIELYMVYVDMADENHWNIFNTNLNRLVTAMGNTGLLRNKCHIVQYIKPIDEEITSYGSIECMNGDVNIYSKKGVLELCFTLGDNSLIDEKNEFYSCNIHNLIGI